MSYLSNKNDVCVQVSYLSKNSPCSSRGNSSRVSEIANGQSSKLINPCVVMPCCANNTFNKVPYLNKQSCCPGHLSKLAYFANGCGNICSPPVCGACLNCCCNERPRPKTPCCKKTVNVCYEKCQPAPEICIVKHVVQHKPARSLCSADFEEEVNFTCKPEGYTCFEFCECCGVTKKICCTDEPAEPVKYIRRERFNYGSKKKDLPRWPFSKNCCHDPSLGNQNEENEEEEDENDTGENSCSSRRAKGLCCDPKTCNCCCCRKKRKKEEEEMEKDPNKYSPLNYTYGPDYYCHKNKAGRNSYFPYNYNYINC